MKPYLLDFNVLGALSWPAHQHHDAVQRWFRAKQRNTFATCPFTAMPGHAFWPDDQPVAKVLLARPGLIGYRQIMDAYLVALARSHGGVLATMDRAAKALCVKGEDRVEVVEGRP